jgi:hypothetical protein
VGEPAIITGTRRRTLAYNGKNSIAYGLNFSTLLQALGARAGLTQPYGSARSPTIQLAHVVIFVSGVTRPE